MNELEIKSKVEIHQEAEKKQEYKLVGSLRMKTGCKLFSYCTETDSGVREVNVQKNNTVSYIGGEVENSKAQFNPDLVYFQAINEKNALRKLDKYKKGDYTVVENFDDNYEPMKFAY